MHPFGNKLLPMNQAAGRTLWIDYLRSFLTVLVVAHHASLAYTTFASFDKVAYIRSTHPVVDASRWIGMDIFENFNDVFFMSLMFLIAGLFVIKSVERKGAWALIRDRFFRLFVPFLLGGTLLNLIAHYPAYLLAHGNGNIRSYVIDFFGIEQWPVGPPWFIWVLFVFNVVFALIYVLKKSLLKSAANAAVEAPAPRTYKPAMVILLWFLFTFVLYVPFAFWLGPGKWTGFGPFDLQITRAALYFGYFMFGAWLGKVRFNEGMFAIDSSLVRRYPIWLIMCAGVYTLLTLSSPLLTELVKHGALTKLTGYIIYFSIYIASCTFSCIAFMTTFSAWAKKQNAAWDSLSEHAYLIYLLHYPFIIWTQYYLLQTPFPAFVKFMIVVFVSVAGSWTLAIPLRKVPIIKKYL